MIGKVDGHIEENNRKIYLVFDSVKSCALQMKNNNY